MDDDFAWFVGWELGGGEQLWGGDHAPNRCSEFPPLRNRKSVFGEKTTVYVGAGKSHEKTADQVALFGG